MSRDATIWSPKVAKYLAPPHDAVPEERRVAISEQRALAVSGRFKIVPLAEQIKAEAEAEAAAAASLPSHRPLRKADMGRIRRFESQRQTLCSAKKYLYVAAVIAWCMITASANSIAGTLLSVHHGVSTAQCARGAAAECRHHEKISRIQRNLRISPCR